MQVTHRLTTEADNGSEIVMVCPEERCGRRLVLKRAGGIVVLDRGDFAARHVGGTSGLGISADLAS